MDECAHKHAKKYQRVPTHIAARDLVNSRCLCVSYKMADNQAAPRDQGAPAIDELIAAQEEPVRVPVMDAPFKILVEAVSADC
jgi:hypothetical protein